MLTRLSSTDYPALAALKTRDTDDFSIALLDAGSVMLDILTFYQERLANECYLRTATQLQSLTELARLIGYQPAPGVGSSVYLSFTLQAASGAPIDPTTGVITIPAGTQVQSVPAQGQSPQTFETYADILAKPDWNAMPVQTGVPWTPHMHDVSVYLEGTATQLQPGDAILIVGDERLQARDATDPRWDIRIVTSVQADTEKNRTYVTWDKGLGDPAGNVPPASLNAKFHALRQRASLFGFNALNPLMLTPKTKRQISGLLSGNEWKFGHTSDGTNLSSKGLVDLDAVYSKLSVGGWLVLTRPDGNVSRSPSGFTTLCRIESVTSISRSDYATSAKITRAAIDNTSDLGNCYTATRSTSILTQSEELAVTEQPLDHPLYGAFIDLKGVRLDLAAVKALAVYGKSPKLQVNAFVNSLVFVPDDGSANLPLKPRDILTVAGPANLPLASDGSIEDWSTSSDAPQLRVLDAAGRTGYVNNAVLKQFTLLPAGSRDPVIQEFALVSSVSLEKDPYPHTRIHLASELLNCYDRTTTSVNTNTGLATQGMSVSEILGSGSASTRNQTFSLKQTPMAFVQSSTPTGSATTLEVTANGIKWKGVPTLYQQPPAARVYATLNKTGGNTDVLFGDGIEGSTLPTGQNNIQANYRTGAGVLGNVAAGAITTLMDRPLGVGGVNNPQAATGGQDAQPINDIRVNAPLSVLTLGRAVSITDYQNFARNFAGIAKAHAIWIPSGPGRGVFITVAAAAGAALPSGNPTLENLVTALHNYGNPLIPIHVRSFLETLFSFKADIKYDPDYDAKAVKQNVLDLLRSSYSFAARTFGQGVSADEIAAVIQSVTGVIACNVNSLQPGATSRAGDLDSGHWSTYAYQEWLIQKETLDRPGSSSPTRICDYLPVASVDKLPDPAEILVLDPDPKNVVLGVLP